MITIKNYINGEWTGPGSGNYLDNYNPAIGEVYSLIPDSGPKEVEMAVEAAKKAFPGWSGMPAEKRSEILARIADLIDKNLDRLAEAESIDNGKTLKAAKTVDIPRASANFRFFATAILHFSSEAHQTTDSVFNYTTHEPLGIVGCISPWNLPLYLFSWKIAPALACGNCVIAKPSEITPMTAYLLSELCAAAGLPPGVLNIIHGKGASVGQAIVEHPDITAISFTGGTETGKAIAKIAAPMFKKISLELGGKNPNIIFDDCDFEKTLKTTVHSSFANLGQICLCGSRILVQRNIYEKFKNALVSEVMKLKVGDPMDHENSLGAIVSEQHYHKILGYIKLAKEEGGRILTGGEALKPEGKFANGYYIQPTLIEGLGPNCRTNQEEIFGPVATIMPFDTIEEAIEHANGTSYGLSATVWTENLNTAHKVAHKLKSGIVWVNTWLLRDLRTPFGGMKNSGVGREGGMDALNFFTEKKNICIKIN